MKAHPMKPFRVCLDSTNMAVRDALSAVRAALNPLELDSEEHGRIELVLAEVLNNIVEHGYPPSASGTIGIEGALKNDGLHLRISDHGIALPEGCTPLGIAAPVDVALDDLPEGGFGWFLIRNLAKDVHYYRRDGENHLHLRLAVGTHS
jgi:serine/threonine-protein kinase RsbW